MEEVALRLMQHNGHFSKTDGSGFDQSDEEVRELCDVLRARPTLEDQIDRLDEVLDTDMYVLGMYVLDTDASVVAISGILHQEQDWNGRTVFRPIA